MITPANVRIMCDLGVHPAAVSVDELVESDDQGETAREEDVFCLRSLLAATPSLSSVREGRDEDAMDEADERGARKRCRTDRSPSCFSFETDDINTGLCRKHALSMSFADTRVRAATASHSTGFHYDHGYSHDLDRDDMRGVSQAQVEEDAEAEADCASVSSCDTDVASHSPSESSFGAMEGTASLSCSSSESSLATTSSECSVFTEPSEMSLSGLSLAPRHSQRDSVACTRAQWGGASMQLRAFAYEEEDEDE